MNERKIALAGMALAAIGVLAALTAWALPEIVTADGGNSITSPDTTGSSGYHTSLALDASGFPVVSYTDISGSDLTVMHCNDPNCAGSDESVTLPDTGGRVGAFASLALDASGYPVVSYYDTTNGDLKVMHCNDPNCDGNDESIVSPDTDGDVGEFTSLALDASGYPVISYYDETNGDLKVMHCNDPDCAGSDESITSPDTADDVGASSSMALDSSGYPVVSYWDRTSLEMKMLHCDDPDCAGDGAVITMPGPGFEPFRDRKSGGGNSLALDASGNPVVGYCINSLVYGDCAMFVVHCNDANCAGGDESITRPGQGGVVFGPISLVLDAFGNPAISYQLGSPNLGHKLLDPGLAMMRCNDPDCSGARDFSVVGSWGVYSSLALDASGYPVVSYAGGHGLRVLHCGDPLCIAGKPVPTVGDASCDGVVDAQDAALILQFAAGLLESLPCPEAGDVNADGDVTAIDAALILQFSAGMISRLPT